MPSSPAPKLSTHFLRRTFSNMSLSSQIISGLILGMIAGILFGPRMGAFEIIGNIFLGLLQMTVLPYIMVSLIAAVGALQMAQAKTLARFGAIVLAMLWSVTLVLIALATLAFPDWQSASYFSPSMLQPPQSFNFVENFIPANIFQALGRGTVPAVVLFSLLLGVAVLRLAEKDDFLKLVHSLQHSIGDMASMVMKTAPYGVFAISAGAAGSIDVTALKGLYVYLVTLTVLSILLTFLVFPLLVKTLTKHRYSDVIAVSKDALITAFATGNLFIVLPIITENTRKLFLKSYEQDSPEANLVEVVVPAAFSLPVAGKLMSLLFVLFAGWFSGEQVAIGDYPALLLGGLVNLFGSSMAAVPSLMDSYKVPSELFELFIISDNIISNRLGSMTSVMFIVVLAILVTSGASGKWRWNTKAILRYIALGLVIVISLSLSLRYLYKVVGHSYSADTEFVERKLLLPASPSFTTLNIPSILPTEPPGNTMQRIQARKKIRVGYYRDWLPYAFNNQQGELVGLDIELWHLLARDLGVAVEFVRVYRKDVKWLLDVHYLDMAAGVAMTPSALNQFTLSSSYFQVHLALLVHKEGRAQLREWQTIDDSEKLKLGVPNAYYLTSSLRSTLPNWHIEEISSPREFLRNNSDASHTQNNQSNLDAVIFGAAGASAWTLLYPEFGVVVPQPALPPVPMAMPLASNDLAWAAYTQQWLKLRQTDGTIEKLTDYWIRGKKPDDIKPTRWNLWDYVWSSPEITAEQK